MQGGWLPWAPRSSSHAQLHTATHMPTLSGKLNLPMHLFLVIRHIFLLTLIRLRAIPPTHSPLPFFHTSAVAPASFAFSPLAALTKSFYCEH